VREAMTKTLALVDLRSPDKARRLAAVSQLRGSDDPAVRGQLLRMLQTETDPEVRKEAQNVANAISTRLTYIGIGVDLFEGISLGSILLLAAIGLSITFGVMGVINMAHGEMIMLGAYSTFVVQQAFRVFLPPAAMNAYLVVAVPVAFAVTALVGIALERSVIRFLYGRPLETLLSTWGISLILQQGVRSIFGPDNQAVANPDWMTGGMELIGGFTLTWNRLVIIFFCFAVLGGLAALLRYSSFGLHMRAVAQNRPMASAMGIRTGMIDALTFGLGSGIAGIAGVALSQIGNVSPNLGQIYIVNCFMVVVFGGVGSLWGTLAGALSLGVATKFIEPFAGAIVGQILVLVFIILYIQRRPRGLFALKGRIAES
jgi:urea transport system permease protein